MEEPSVLDYLKDKLTFWNKSTLSIPPGDGDSPLLEAQTKGNRLQKRVWKSILILFPFLFAILAQGFSEQDNRSRLLVIFFYFAAAMGLTLLILFRNWDTDPLQREENIAGEFKFRWIQFLVGAGFSILAFLFFLSNIYNVVNLTLWITGFCLVWWSLRVPGDLWENISSAWNGVRQGGFKITPWMLLVGAVFLISAFFRLYLLDKVPPEMFSDHAEKLIDVTDVLNGQYSIFFIRNTGREAFQMYLTALVTKVFGTGISFLSLKLGTCLVGLFTLPFIYLLGKEIKSKEVGLLAMFFAGIAYWPNVISRVALRFTLYPAFAAPALFFLVRGLKRKTWNDFLFAGLFLGIGLHGYSTFRIFPFIVIATLVVFLIQTTTRENRRQVLIALLLIGIISLIIFLPLLRFAISNYDLFLYRMQTRMTGIENELPGPVINILFSNLWKSLIMFQWDNGQIWVHSIDGRPALGVITAALFSLGVLLILVRNLKKFQLKYLVFLVLSFVLLLMPAGLFSMIALILGTILVVIFDRQTWNRWDLIMLLLLAVLLIVPLNWITLSVFLFGMGLLLFRTRREWHWMDIVLLLWIPLLVLPSALAIAFPEENPSLNRSGGAIVPVFLIAAIALENILTNFKAHLPDRLGKWLSYGFIVLVALTSMGINYRLVFDDYYHQYKIRAWNTSEIGGVIREFSETIGDESQAWVVPYPHWVDTRLVGIHASGRVKDLALWPSELYRTEYVGPPKLFIYKPDDKEAIQTLQDLYPTGIINRFQSEVEGQDFMLYYVLE